MKRAILFPCLSAGALALAMTGGCGQKKGGPPPRPPVVVQTALAVQRDTPIVIAAFGTTSERASVDVVPQVSGTLVETFITDGAVVTNGQPLFRIDASDYEARVRQAESLLAADRANLDMSLLTLERNSKLLNDKLISQQDYDTLKFRTTGLEAQVTADTAALDLARTNLARCLITAPLGGVCSKRAVDNGNLVAAGMTRLVNIRSYNPLNVDFAVPEKNLTSIRDAMQQPPVRMTARPRGGANAYDGTLVFVDNAVNPTTGTIALRGELPNPALKLWANQFVEVHVVAGTVRNAVMVPEGAVQFGKQGPYLFAVTSSNTAALRLVQTGVRHADQLQIVSGVVPGERVVVLGQLMLGPGSTVVDVSQMPPPGAAPAGGPAAAGASAAKPTAGGAGRQE